MNLCNLKKIGWYVGVVTVAGCPPHCRPKGTCPARRLQEGADLGGIGPRDQIRPLSAHRAQGRQTRPLAGQSLLAIFSAPQSLVTGQSCVIKWSPNEHIDLFVLG